MSDSTTTTTTTYVVAGMTCEHCVRSVTESLTALPGVTGVEVDLTSGRVTVSSDRPVDDGSVRAAVIDSGYEVVT